MPNKFTTTVGDADITFGPDTPKDPLRPYMDTLIEGLTKRWYATWIIRITLNPRLPGGPLSPYEHGLSYRVKTCHFTTTRLSERCAGVSYLLSFLTATNALWYIDFLVAFGNWWYSNYHKKQLKVNRPADIDPFWTKNNKDLFINWYPQLDNVLERRFPVNLHQSQ